MSFSSASSLYQRNSSIDRGISFDYNLCSKNVRGPGSERKKVFSLNKTFTKITAIVLAILMAGSVLVAAFQSIA